MQYDRLVAPAVSLLAVLILLLVARNYEALSVIPPPCSLRSLTGIPCVACGGTRSVRALAEGQLIDAVIWNPLVVFAVFVIALWFVCMLVTVVFQGGVAEVKAKAAVGKFSRRWGLLIAVLLLMNWVYLICYLPS